jgi:hypothetical protein
VIIVANILTVSGYNFSDGVFQKLPLPVLLTGHLNTVCPYSSGKDYKKISFIIKSLKKMSLPLELYAVLREKIVK